MTRTFPSNTEYGLRKLKKVTKSCCKSLCAVHTANWQCIQYFRTVVMAMSGISSLSKERREFARCIWKCKVRRFSEDVATMNKDEIRVQGTNWNCENSYYYGIICRRCCKRDRSYNF